MEICTHFTIHTKQGLFEVTHQVGEIDYGISLTHRCDALQFPETIERVAVAIVRPEKVPVQSCLYWLSKHKKEAYVLVYFASWSVSWTAKS